MRMKRKKTYRAVGGNIISTDSVENKLEATWKLKNSDTKFVFYSKMYTEHISVFLV